MGYEMDFDSFKRLRIVNRLTAEETALLMDVSTRTVKNWESNNNPPGAAVKLLKIRCGDLGGISDRWKGFYFDGDVIALNKKDFVYPEEVLCLKYLFTAAGINRSNLYKANKFGI